MTTPQRLVVRRDPEHLWAVISDEHGGYVGDIQWHPNADEIVRRYNLHDELVKALESVKERLGYLDEGVDGESPADLQISAAWTIADAALARVRKEGTE